jgi:hypothetical protein
MPCPSPPLASPIFPFAIISPPLCPDFALFPLVPSRLASLSLRWLSHQTLGYQAPRPLLTTCPHLLPSTLSASPYKDYAGPSRSPLSLIFLSFSCVEISLFYTPLKNKLYLVRFKERDGGSQFCVDGKPDGKPAGHPPIVHCPTPLTFACLSLLLLVNTNSLLVILLWGLNL